MMKIPLMPLLMAISIALNAAAFAAAPAAGEAYVYRVTNGYSREAAGEVTYRVEKVEADRVQVAVTTTAASMGAARNEIYTRDGNWLRAPLFSHTILIDYEFASAFPAYEFPLDTGKSWSRRVTANVPSKSKTVSVRVDAEVLGAERVTVAVGTFDAIKIRRLVYAGDQDMPDGETQITEFDWYSPVLGCSVKIETKSIHLDQRGGGDEAGPHWVKGDWNVLELIKHGAK